MAAWLVTGRRGGACWQSRNRLIKDLRVGFAVVGTRRRLPSFTDRDISASGPFGAVRIRHGVVTSGHAESFYMGRSRQRSLESSCDPNLTQLNLAKVDCEHYEDKDITFFE